MNIDKIRRTFLTPQETDDRAQMLLGMILSICNPISVILFGSAARYQLTPSSDLDVVVVFSTLQEMKAAQKPLHASCGSLPFPVDFLLVDKETYERKSLIGGALFEARSEGRPLLG